MQYLISINKINHIENIKKIHRKWQIIIMKYDLIKRFSKSLNDIYVNRTKIYMLFLGTHI